MSEEALGTLALVGIVAAATAGYLGAFGQSGSDYFQACWERRVAQTKAKFGDVQAQTPQQAIAWAGCERISKKAIYDAGFIFAGGKNRDVEDEKIAAVCPSSWSDVPMGGTYMLTVKLIEDRGGPKFWDKFLPADFMIKRVWEERWPKCAAERERQQYPKIVEQQSGAFEWSRPCARCE